MSIVSGNGQAGDYEIGMQENQLAVWLRNVPTWLDELRFYDEISNWFDVDKDKSHCFKNKQDSSWIGIRYGWAIVTFKSKRARNIFLEDEDRHFVRESEDAPYEKLKVSPWYDKQKTKPTYTKIEKPLKIVPLYKSDLEKELESNSFTIEDFARNCTDTSIQSYKGKIQSYITNYAGLGHVGSIEIDVLVKNEVQTELIVFHSDTVWMCFKHNNCAGTTDCAVKCGTDNFLPNRLKIGTEVNFNARKIPHGMVEGRRYQAKAIWIGQDTQPNFITPPPASKLDDYLQDYITEYRKGSSKDPSPDFETVQRARSLDTPVSNESGNSSPLPGITIANRPKPLKGGLNQLNSSQDKTKSIATLKKPQPTNFAQAVASAPTLIREEHSNLILAVGFVESVISEVEAIISVPEHGTFNLHLKHLDLGYKPTQGINKFLTAKLSTVSVTLKQGKVLPGSKPKYEIVRAHLNDDKKVLEDKFDPFVNEFKPKKKDNQPAAPDTWEELVDEPSEHPKHNQDNGDCDIDLDELDEYYDDLQGIVEYLEKELPKVIPTIAHDEKCFQTLANRILCNTRSPDDEANELQVFLDQYHISARIKSIFISEYVKFRNAPVRSEKDSATDSDMKISPEKEKATEQVNDINRFVGDDKPINIQEQKDMSVDINRQTETSVTTVFHLFKNIDLSSFEKEFIKHQDKVKETSGFILRAIHFLKICEIKFEGLYKLHIRHMEESSKPRNREFNHKIQHILTKRANQKILDETNSYIQRCMGLKMKEHTPISYRRLEKYIPILSQSLCVFFCDKYEARYNIKYGDREKSPRKREFFDNDLKNNTAEFIPDTTFSTKIDILEGKQNSKSDGYVDAEFMGFTHFLELSIASGRISLAPTASVEGILWTFQARNVAHSSLEDIYVKSQEQGGCSWQLQISQLKLNPPLGVTVPDIAEYLSAYFASIKNTPNLSASEDEDVLVEDIVTIDTPDESELMTMIQTNLFDQYKEPELISCLAKLKKSSIKVRESELINSYEELFSSHYLFNSSGWPHNEDIFDFASTCALLSAGIWHDLNVTSDFLLMCVRNIHENETPYQSVLIKWAKLLETSSFLSGSVVDIFTIVRATMISYDENVPEDDLLNISTNYCLYNVEGYVSKHLSSHFYVVQTRFSLVICHLGTTYTHCTKTSSHMIPSERWNMCSLDCCLPVGTKVLLHSTGIKDSKDKIMCQISDIVWTPVEDKYDPPETGIILPGNGQYKKYVQYFAEKYIAKSYPDRFADTNFSANNQKYLALEEQHSRPRFSMTETWPQNTLEMQKMFVFSEMGGMSRPLLRSNWAAALNTSDQEKERLLNETFNFFQSDSETLEMIKFIGPYVERAGLRNAMKVLNQNYPGKNDEQESLNDTDSEKRQNLAVDDCESSEEVETLEEMNNKETVTTSQSKHTLGLTRNRQLSTDTIKDETLWMAENNLEQLWADEADQMKIDKMVDVEEEVLDDDSDVQESSSESITDENPEKEINQLGAIGTSVNKSNHLGAIGTSKSMNLGAIGSSKSKSPVNKMSLSPVLDVDYTSETQIGSNNCENGSPSPNKPSSKLEETSPLPIVRQEDLERIGKYEEAIFNLSAWQPMASDIISGNRDLIMQLNNRIEFLESALNQLTLSLATGRQSVETKEQEKEQIESRKGSRTYVKISKDGGEDDIAEVPTNSDGLLPQMTVKALYEGTSAMKYRVNGNSKTWRALLLEDELFHPPEDGWGDRVYTCTQPQGCVWVKNDTASTSITASNPGLAGPTGSSSLDHSLTTPLSYSVGQSNNIVSPYLGLPPMHQIWGNGGGLSLTSQISPGVGQSMFSNVQNTLGNLGALNSLGTSGNAFKSYPTNFGKK